jgi:transposase
MRESPWVVSDGLWERVEPLLPRRPRRFRYPGRKPLDDQQVRSGILFVLHTGIAWEHLPQQLGFGSGMTCWRRLRAWQEAGVWQRLHALLLAERRRSRLVAGSRGFQPDPSEKRGAATGPSPVDRGRPGSKHDLLTDGGGLPLAWALTAGNRHDVTQLLPLLDAVPAVRGRVGRPRRRPARLVADRGYDYKSHRRQLWARGIKPVIARRKTKHGSGLGRERCVVERTFAWLHQRRRLLVRYDRRAEIHEAFLALACCLICWRRLQNSLC